MEYGITFPRMEIAEQPSPWKDLTHFAREAERMGCAYGVVGDRLEAGLDLPLACSPQWTTNEAEQGLAITAPPDLQDRLQQLPREVRSRDNRYDLCADPARLKRAIELARQAKPISLLSSHHNPGGGL